MPEEKSVLLDVYQRLGGIEAKIDDIKSIRQTADTAQATANRAEQKADTNAKDIEDIREEMAEARKEADANKRWRIGLTITIVSAIVGTFIALLQYI